MLVTKGIVDQQVSLEVDQIDSFLEGLTSLSKRLKLVNSGGLELARFGEPARRSGLVTKFEDLEAQPADLEG